MDATGNAHTETDLRSRLERQLHRPVPDELWDDLVEHGYVDDALTRAGWADLVREARRLLRFVKLGASGRVPHRIPAAARAPTLKARATALGAWAARYARGDMFVGRRGSWLDTARGYLGGTFDRDDAVAHLQSPAWSLVPLAELVARREPRRLGPGDSGRIRNSLATVRRATDATLDGVVGVRIELELVYERERRDLAIWQSPRARSLTVEVPETGPVRVLAAAGTLNERLLGLATQSQWGPLTVSQTLWLLLTDEAPQVRPLAADVRREFGPNLRPRDIITLEAEPWVPVSAVVAAYREIRADYVPQPNHPQGRRSLELARFLAGEGWGLSISAQWGLWNERFPDWKVRDRGNFAKDARRATKLLLGSAPARVARPHRS